MALTVEQWKEKLTEEMKNMPDYSVYNVCDQCSKGLMSIYSPSLQKYICQQNCTPNTARDLSFIDLRMMRVDKLAKVAHAQIGKQVEVLNSEIQKKEAEAKTFKDAEDFSSQTLLKVLNNQATKINELIAAKDTLVKEIFPKLFELTDNNSKRLESLKKTRDELVKIQGTINPAVDPINYATYAEATFNTELDKVCQANEKLSCSEQELESALIETMPLHFKANPDIYTQELIEFMIPKLMVGLEQCYPPKPPVAA